MEPMAPEQARFIRQLKITLVSVLGPFILLAAGSLVKDHYAIKNMKAHVVVLEETYVSQDILLLYLNELREYNKILRERVKDNADGFTDRLNKIDDKLDYLMKEVYSFRVRGGNPIDSTSIAHYNQN